MADQPDVQYPDVEVNEADPPPVAIVADAEPAQAQGAGAANAHGDELEVNISSFFISSVLLMFSGRAI
jgi:hypothetical protein